MIAQKKRFINESKQFDKYFEKAKMTTFVVKKNAELSDTVKAIKKIIPQYKQQASKIAKVLKGRDLKDTCKNIWNFVYQNIQYKEDKTGTEELRVPNRVWADRFSGVDCDCYSLLIGCIFENLGIKYKLRLAEYNNKGYFQHIYPIVLTGKKRFDFFTMGNEDEIIVIDCVMDNFNKEQGYTNYEDVEMDLHRLEGFGLGTPDRDYEKIDDEVIPTNLQEVFENERRKELELEKEMRAKWDSEDEKYKNKIKTEIQKSFDSEETKTKEGKKEDVSVDDGTKPKRFSKEWFKKYAFETTLVGVGTLTFLALIVSFMGNNKKEEVKEKELEGFKKEKNFKLPKKLK